MVAEWVRALAWTGDRTVPAGFESHCGKLRFGTLAIPFTPLCQCLSEETLKAVGPFTPRAPVYIMLFVAVLFIYGRTCCTCS